MTIYVMRKQRLRQQLSASQSVTHKQYYEQNKAQTSMRQHAPQKQHTLQTAPLMHVQQSHPTDTDNR